MTELFFLFGTVLAPDRMSPSMLPAIRVPDGARLPAGVGLPDTAGMCNLSPLMWQHIFAKGPFGKEAGIPNCCVERDALKPGKTDT